MRVTEQQLLILLSLAKEVLDGTLEASLDGVGVREGLQKLFDEIMIQQNEIVDTSNYLSPTLDQYRRLAFDLYEALEITADDPEDFYDSPMGKIAGPLLYPEVTERRQRARDQEDE